MKLKNVRTSTEQFEEVNKAVLDGITANMSSLVKAGHYGAMNCNDPQVGNYYIIKFLSDPYTLQNEITVDGQILKDGELVADACYLTQIRQGSNWYVEAEEEQQLVTVSMRTVVHPQLNTEVVKDAAKIPQSLCSRTQARQLVMRNPIVLTEEDHDFIMDENVHWDKIDYERRIERGDVESDFDDDNDNDSDIDGN